MIHINFMLEAIKLAEDNIKNKFGGPYGAVVVKDCKIIGRSSNLVLKNNDSTAHAEICAIRNAEKNIKNYNLSGCDIYTSCEPCPMCLMAIEWANIDNIYFAANRNDAAEIYFRDEEMYAKLKNNVKTGIHIKECQPEAVAIMQKWANMENKQIY